MDKTAMIFCGVLGLGLLFLLLRNKSGYSQEYAETEEVEPVSPKSIPLSFTPTSHKSAHHYKNEEVWDIDWNEDGLPKRVTIHRNAVQT